MQKYTGTVERSNSRNALELIIKDLQISDLAKNKLLEDLRSLGVLDDNDPIVKITLLQGLYSKYIGGMIQKLSSERKQIEMATHEFKAIKNNFAHDLVELKNNIKIWKDGSVKELERGIEKLLNDQSLAKNKLAKLEEQIEDKKY